ncbi:MAG: hypothetical protein ACQESP_05760 [Candidatus Muiribacteriota bacterium]
MNSTVKYLRQVMPVLMILAIFIIAGCGGSSNDLTADKATISNLKLKSKAIISEEAIFSGNIEICYDFETSLVEPLFDLKVEYQEI